MIKDKGLEFNHRDVLTRSIAIAPSRDKYFMDLINQYKTRYPGMKLIYANNTTGNQVHDKPTADFVLIFKVQAIPKPSSLAKVPKTFIMLECPLQFSDRSLAGWTMAVEQNNMDGYFQYMIDTAARLSWDRFQEYIEAIALLSLDKNSDLYWKKPENSEAFTSRIMQLCAQYNPSKPGSKIQQTKDYATK